MRRRLFHLGFLVAGMILAARLARADELLEPPRPRQGYYVAFGGHATTAYLREDGQWLGPWAGPGLDLRFGQLLTRRLGLGLALDFSGASGNDQAFSLMSFGAAGQVELAYNLALHGSVGVGVLGLREAGARSSNPDASRSGGYGAAYTLGLTYDWFFTSRETGGWALTPSLRFRALPGDTAVLAAFVGLELTWWSGLPRHQLDVGPSKAFDR